MHLLRLSLVALLLTISASASAAPKVPLAYEPLKKFTLGMSYEELGKTYDVTKIPGDENGIRRFSLDSHGHQPYASRIICEFEADANFDYHLVYAEIEFTAEYVKENPFSAVTARYVQELGAFSPKLHPAYLVSPEESLMWESDSAVLVIGRTSSAYLLVLARPARFKTVVAALTKLDDERKAAEALVRAEAERKSTDAVQQAAKGALLEAAQVEWQASAFSFWLSVFRETARDVRRGADRIMKAAIALHAADGLSDSDLADVKRWVSRVKKTTAEKTATIRSDAGWQEIGLKMIEMRAFVRASIVQKWRVSGFWKPNDLFGSRNEKGFRVTELAFTGALICDGGPNTEVVVFEQTSVTGATAIADAGTSLRCRINDTDTGNNDGTMQVYALVLPSEPPPIAELTAQEKAELLSPSK